MREIGLNHHGLITTASRFEANLMWLNYDDLDRFLSYQGFLASLTLKIVMG